METRIQAAAKVGRRLCFALLVTQTGIALADDELRISEASWDDGRLRVSGRDAERRATVELYNAAGGAVLKTTEASSDGEFTFGSALNKHLVGYALATVAAMPSGTVRDAPSDCDSQAGADRDRGRSLATLRCLPTMIWACTVRIRTTGSLASCRPITSSGRRSSCGVKNRGSCHQHDGVDAELLRRCREHR